MGHVWEFWKLKKPNRIHGPFLVVVHFAIFGGASVLQLLTA
jgi:hypothetical protein